MKLVSRLVTTIKSRIIPSDSGIHINLKESLWMDTMQKPLTTSWIHNCAVGFVMNNALKSFRWKNLNRTRIEASLVRWSYGGKTSWKKWIDFVTLFAAILSFDFWSSFWRSYELNSKHWHESAIQSGSRQGIHASGYFMKQTGSTTDNECDRRERQGSSTESSAEAELKSEEWSFNFVICLLFCQVWSGR